MGRGRGVSVAVAVVAGLSVVGCGDQMAGTSDAGPPVDAPAAVDDAALAPPDAGAPDAGSPPCHTSRNPSGAFAVTAIRSHTDGQPGNTWEAVSAAWEAGVRYIEIDVRLSRDGALIPGRVDLLEAFTSCTGSLRETDAADLAACTYLSDPSIAVLPLTEGMVGVDFDGVYLDLKFTEEELAGEIEPALAAVEEVRQALPRPEVVVAMSYSAPFAAAFVAAGARAGWKGYPDAGEAAAFVAAGHDLGVEMLCAEAIALDAALLDESAELGLWHLPWEYPSRTDEVLLNLLYQHGAGGLITDRVADLTALVPPACGIPRAR